MIHTLLLNTLIRVNPVSFMFLFLFAPVALLVAIGFFGLIRLIIKENRLEKKKKEEKKN